MDGRVRHASDSCLAESPGKDHSFCVSHYPWDCSTALSAAQAVCYLAKNAQNARFGQVAPGEWYPLSHFLMSHPVFHYFPGFREAAAFQVDHAQRGRWL